MTPPNIDENKGDILIVDDTPENLRLLSKTLTEQGYEVRAVKNGAMALSAVQMDPPDLVLLDIRMPEMNGYEVCQQLKANVKTYDIPVIFLSALDDTLDKVTAFEVGGVDYITKPFQTEEVIVRVENQLTITRLREKLVAQNEELLHSNRQLEQFAYVVSHDLQQPLQVILGFAKLLGFKFEQNLGNEGLEFVARITTASTQMKDLIEDLLTYSRIGAEPKPLEPTDCETLLAQVLANMQIAIDQQGATITHDPLPTVMADAVLLAVLFQNLIDNAIKFHRPEEPIQVRISAEYRPDEWLFGVHDNGIGIDSTQSEQIFKAFQRIHSQQEYPGTGIGLEPAKRSLSIMGDKFGLCLNPVWAQRFTLLYQTEITKGKADRGG
ncbi:Phytochrome-like protein cph1 [Acaryochloris thomasi RCC1774]|uniref:histidine kinase n=1 Tax=Acaryochloris thomasi RCC1774 TaxID=1764569 RepID=A0A2W1J9D6_9CYAN|nr:Phytochrome-like protein cph1 [Acaryochloris thomasi RCC1774]